MSRTIRFASFAAAALAAAATTACSDGPTAPAAAPTPAAAPAEASAARGGEGALFQNYGRIRVSNPQGTLLKSTVTFIHLTSNAKVVVTDNGAGDLDGMIGRVNAALPWSGGKVRAIATMDAPYSSRGFVDKDLVIGQNDFNTLVVKYMPVLVATLTRTDSPLLVAGGGIRVVRVGDGALQAHVLDNQKGDVDPTIGRIQAYYDTDWKVRVSEDPIPTGFQAPTNWKFDLQLPFKDAGSASHAWTWSHVRFKI